MGFVSHRVKGSDLAAGDHIYSWRAAFAYSHHGIYVGEDRVLHFMHQLKRARTCHSSSASSTSFPDCGFKKSGSGVTVSCLNCFMGYGSLYRYKYGAGLLVYIVKIRGGTCTTAKSDDPEAVIHRAMYLLDNGFAKYNLLKYNCEDFALYCKTGLLVTPKQACVGGSGQVFYWYKFDIGDRRDVVKVEVEEVAAFIGN